MQHLGNSFLGMNLIRLVGGLLVTLRIAIISIILALTLGILFGLMMLSKSKIIRSLSKIYLEAFRMIPILVWLFIVYFGVANALSLHIQGEVAAIIVFSLWGIAEMGDLVRAAISSLPSHQKQSGKALGLSEKQINYYILLPQMMRRLVPAAINLVTRMIKTTSLVVLIGVVEVVKVGQQIIESSVFENTTVTFWIYGLIFILYFIVCYPISLGAKKLERRWGE